MTRLLVETIQKKNTQRPPVWLMRQAGRYHAHYQKLRAKHSFEDLCKNPELACEVTLGPMRDFDFDSAILFSDLLFPLEALGLGLSYRPGPTFDRLLTSMSDIKNLKTPKLNPHPLHYQNQAIHLIRSRLPDEKALIGFVGSPFTLYLYARFGAHDVSKDDFTQDFSQGWFDLFWEKLKDLLLTNMLDQAEAGPDAIALFDTSAGNLPAPLFEEFVVPKLKWLFDEFKSKKPHCPLIYYSKNTAWDHWKTLEPLAFEVLGIDWHTDLCEVLSKYSNRWTIQGNMDPHFLNESPEAFESKARSYLERIKRLSPLHIHHWICGLGHGVLPQAKEANVKKYVQLIKEVFGDSK